MWIEVIGLPGVGKTTMIENNTSIIEEGFHIIRSDHAPFLQKIMAKLLYYFCYNLKLSDKNLAKKMAYRHGFRLFKKRKDNLFFYDSGLLQAILENLIETGFKDQEQKLKIIAPCLLPDKIIYIKDDTDLAAEREVKRIENRFEFDLQTTKQYYEQAETVIEKEILQNIKITDTISPHTPSDFKKALNTRY